MWGDDEYGSVPFSVSESDLAYEMGQRKKRKVTKEEAMLGVFGGDDSSDEEPRSRFASSKKQSYTAPISFVSKGVLDPGSLSQPAGPADTTKVSTQPKNVEKPVEKPTRPHSQKKKTGNQKEEDKLADWDITGKASKMMKLMGYTGGGLGRDGKGIAKAVDAGPVRPKNMGLAFNNYKESKTELKKEEEVVEIMDEEEDSMPLSYWKKGQPKRPKRSYQTPKEASKTAQSTLKIIDMTKGAPVVSDNLDALKPGTKAPYLPELFYNLQTILDLKESSASDRLQRKGFEANLITQLEKERNSYQLQVAEESLQLQRFRRVQDWVDSCKKKFTVSQDMIRRNPSVVLQVDEDKEEAVDAPLTLPYLYRCYKHLQENYLYEWNHFELVLLTFHLVFPLMKNALAVWEPISNPAFGLDLFQTWKSVLDPDVVNFGGKREITETPSSGSPFQPLPPSRRSKQGLSAAEIRVARKNHRNAYLRLFYDVLLPKLRESFMNTWNPQTDPASAIKVLTLWNQILPSEIREIILEQVIMGRLRQEVSSWDPLKASVRISDWLHPWMDILGEDRMSQLWKPVLTKLSTALRMWNAKDKTAHIMLSPWKRALHPFMLEEFLRGTILPKLSEIMKNWQINPSAQDHSVWSAVLLWHDMFQPETFVVFLLNTFFPKWLATLHTWLSNKPNTADVAQWYSEWKKTFPLDIVMDPFITQQFNVALEMMQSFMTGQLRSLPAPQHVSLPRLQSFDFRKAKREEAKQERQKPDTKLSKPTSTSASKSQNIPRETRPAFSEPTTFRQLVEEIAKKNDILFIPTKRSFESKTIFTFGKISLVIDKNMLLVWKNNKWAPVGLDELITLAQ